MFADGDGPGHDHLTRAQRSAFDAMGSVVVAHLDDHLDRRHADASAPLLYQIDGPNSTHFANVVSDRLRGEDRPQRWTVIHFDAWQYQRVQPPWWWLLSALDRELHAEFRSRGWTVVTGKRVRDYAWRTGEFLKDLVPVLPLFALVAGLWYLTGQTSMDQFLRWIVGVLGGIGTLAALVVSISNGVRRLFVASPASVGASQRTSDPMADFQRRYSFLVRSAKTPVALLIENLDRCRADYVVELLEGIQTLLKSSASSMRPTPLVAVLIPGSRSWLCESYVHVYNEFAETARQPGRPFGLAFVDKVFDFELRLPTVPPEASIVAPGTTSPSECRLIEQANRRIKQAGGEKAIRRLVAEAESEFHAAGRGRPLYEVRISAVERLGSLEAHQEPLGFQGDTNRELARLIDTAGADSTVIKQLPSAYCVQRTSQMLGGHRIDDRDDAIARLGVWTILDIRWPLLTQHLALFPDNFDMLLQRSAPEGITEELASLFLGLQASHVVTACVELTVDDIRRFSMLEPGLVPSPVEAPNASSPAATSCSSTIGRQAPALGLRIS